MPILLTPMALNAQQQAFAIVDVRGGLEYWMGHVPGARRLSRQRILKEIPQDRAIALTCLSGTRSAMVAHWLVAQGYTQVHNLSGGLLAWQQAGYPVRWGYRP